MLRLIRHEKFDLVLPGALRDNNVDMWIHVVESGKKDPLGLDLGGWFEYQSREYGNSNRLLMSREKEWQMERVLQFPKERSTAPKE